MRNYAPGVLPASDYYFYTPSAMAREVLLYELCVGQYYCGPAYSVNRDFHNSYLIMGVVDGACEVSQGGRAALARPGDVILLDCHEPHAYAARDCLEMVFVHLSGQTALDYFRTITRSRGLAFRHEAFPALYEDMQQLLAPCRAGRIPRETDVHMTLTRILCGLLTTVPTASGGADAANGPINDAIAYVVENLAEDLTLAGLADLVNMSPFHFSRQFKAQTGYSPYEFIINSRIDSAKHLLKQSDLSIREVAYSVGFNSESNFIHTFRQRVGQTPNQFRKVEY